MSRQLSSEAEVPRDGEMRKQFAVCLLATLIGACMGRHADVQRSPTKAWLNMPETADGRMPTLLSQTGAFINVRQLQPANGLLPYDLVLAFWSDGADKTRFVAIP